MYRTHQTTQRPFQSAKKALPLAGWGVTVIGTALLGYVVWSLFFVLCRLFSQSVL